MKATLKIYKGPELVNTFEWTDDADVLREFAKCITAKYRGIKTRVSRTPYIGTYHITHTWPYDEVIKDTKYAYVFEGIENA